MNDVTGHFEILVDGNLETYTRIGDIPLIIDNVIKFQPDIPDGPHTEEQHEEYAKKVHVHGMIDMFAHLPPLTFLTCLLHLCIQNHAVQPYTNMCILRYSTAGRFRHRRTPSPPIMRYKFVS